LLKVISSLLLRPRRLCCMGRKHKADCCCNRSGIAGWRQVARVFAEASAVLRHEVLVVRVRAVVSPVRAIIRHQIGTAAWRGALEAVELVVAYTRANVIRPDAVSATVELLRAP